MATMRGAMVALFAWLITAAAPASAGLRMERVATLPPDAYALEAIAPMAGGGFAAVWHRGTYGPGDSLHLGVFGADGSLLAERHGCLEEPRNLSTRLPKLLALSGGGIILACDTYSLQSLSRLTWRAYGDDLVPAGPQQYSDGSLAFAELDGMAATGTTSFVLHYLACAAIDCRIVLVQAGRDGLETSRVSRPARLIEDTFHLHGLDDGVLLGLRRRWHGAPQSAWDMRALPMGADGHRLAPSLILAPLSPEWPDFPVVMTAAGRTALLGAPTMSIETGTFLLRMIDGGDLVGSKTITFSKPRRTRDWFWAGALPLRRGFLLIGSAPWMVERMDDDGRATSQRLRLPGLFAGRGPTPAAGLNATVVADGEDSFLVGVLQPDDAPGRGLEVWRLSVR